MGRFGKILLLCSVAGLLASCDKGLGDLNGKGGSHNGGSESSVTATEPAPCTNKIVAHRGGSTECGMPDNSKASLRYAMSLKLYGSECDIYWTKDNNVVIAHASDAYYINGLRPYEHTLTELRKRGKLKNGEELPTLEEFLGSMTNIRV